MIRFEAFEPRDYRELPVTVSIVKQAASTHFGLGSLIALLKVFDIANMGIIIVGSGGIGKTASIKGLESMLHKQHFAEEFTQAGTTDDVNAFLTRSRTTWVCYDLSKTSVFFAENMFRVVCALLTDHEMHTTCSMYSVDIDDAYISWIGAATYPIYKRLITSDLWDGTYRERICRVYQFPYRRRQVTEDPPKINLDLVNPHVKFVQSGHGKRLVFRKLDGVHCARTYIDQAKNLLRNQFSNTRTVVYAPNLLKASAVLNGRTTVVQADLKFLQLFEFSFQVEHMLGKRMGLASPIFLDAEAVALASIVLETPGINAIQIYAEHRAPQEYTTNCFLRNHDIFYTPDRGVPPEAARLYLQPRLLAMVNRQYDFEDMCLRLPM